MDFAEKRSWDAMVNEIISLYEKTLSMKNSSTKFLFTYGRQEGAVYQVDLEDSLTCKYFSDLENFVCGIHEAGHCFPQTEIQNFLHQVLN